MDIRLPDINGLEVTKMIRDFRPEIPIIAHTAYAFDGSREKALNAGCNDYIEKPVHKEQLFELLQKFLE